MKTAARKVWKALKRNEAKQNKMSISTSITTPSIQMLKRAKTKRVKHSTTLHKRRCHLINRCNLKLKLIAASRLFLTDCSQALTAQLKQVLDRVLRLKPSIRTKNHEFLIKACTTKVCSTAVRQKLETRLCLTSMLSALIICATRKTDRSRSFSS